SKIKYKPVDEDHPMLPRPPYALNKTAAENMYSFYYSVHGLKTVSLRISNPYGPGSQMKHSKYSMINWFIRQAMDGYSLKIFGDGEQVRDYIYVEDLAEAFITASITSECYGKVFNVGSGTGVRFIDMAESVVRSVGMGNVEKVPWPKDYVNVETGDYVADITRIKAACNWKSSVSFQEGIDRTVAFYRVNQRHYW
ncbi:MAG: NAD-dependent epimerase/dehydratase family protein, partial [Lentisphaerae bacterium]|nr:NAD-dependent epimerase/dehydratase family protein [Lentisphaerota bacterium]